MAPKAVSAPEETPNNQSINHLINQVECYYFN